jgi:hypothetical protein
MAGLDPATHAVKRRKWLQIDPKRHCVDDRVKHGHDNEAHITL